MATSPPRATKRAAPGDVPVGMRPANPHGAPDGVEGQTAWVALTSGMSAYVRARREFATADGRSASGEASSEQKVKVVQGVWVLAHPPSVDPVQRALAALRERGVTRVLTPPLAARGKARLEAWLRHVLTSVDGVREPRAMLLPLLGQYTSAELGAVRAELGAAYVGGAKSVKPSVARKQAALPFVLATYATPAAPHTRNTFDRVRWARALTLWPIIDRPVPANFRAFAQRRSRELGVSVPPGADRAMPVHVNAFMELRAAGVSPPNLPWHHKRAPESGDASYGLARHSEATPTSAASEALRASVSRGGAARVPSSSEWESGVFARHLWWHALRTMGSVNGNSAARPPAGAAAGDAKRVCALQAADSATRGALVRGGSGVSTRGVGLSDGLMRAVHAAAQARMRLGLAVCGTARRAHPGLHPGITRGLTYRRDLADALRAGAAARNNARIVWTRVLHDTAGAVFCPDLGSREEEVGLEYVTRGGGGPAVARVLEGMCEMTGLPAERWGGREFVSARYGKAAAAHI